MLAEAATRLRLSLSFPTDDALLERLVGFWARRSPAGPVGEPLRLRPGKVSDLAGLKKRVSDLVAIDLGPLETWPKRPASLQGADVLWACDPAGPRAPGGFLAFRDDGVLYRSIRDAMLFFVGSLHDGGLSAEDMARFAEAIDP